MNLNLKWSAFKLAVLLGTASVLLTGCFVWRGHDRDRHESSRHEEREHHDQDHHEDQEHHEDSDHH